jgi:hypothetical protein
MSVMDFMSCSFVTYKDQLIHLSGSLINGTMERSRQLSPVSNHHKNLNDITQDRTGDLQIMKPALHHCATQPITPALNTRNLVVSIYHRAVMVV